MNISSLIPMILAFILLEVVLIIIFKIIAPKNVPGSVTPKTVIKGVVERIFLIVSLINGVGQAIVLFGTLKVASRLTDAKKAEPAFNDFYLMGNMLSVLGAIAYVHWYNNLM